MSNWKRRILSSVSVSFITEKSWCKQRIVSESCVDYHTLVWSSKSFSQLKPSVKNSLKTCPKNKENRKLESSSQWSWLHWANCFLLQSHLNAAKQAVIADVCESKYHGYFHHVLSNLCWHQWNYQWVLHVLPVGNHSIYKTLYRFT